MADKKKPSLYEKTEGLIHKLKRKSVKEIERLEKEQMKGKKKKK